MVLGKSLTDWDGKTYPMAGLLPITVDMGERLYLGYREAKVLRPTLLAPAGDRLRGHEFHRSRSSPPAQAQSMLGDPRLSRKAGPMSACMLPTCISTGDPVPISQRGYSRIF
jgi:cobyrinic acid a,c-diamide synthase